MLCGVLKKALVALPSVLLVDFRMPPVMDGTPASVPC
jgi:hypothetical protein